MGGSIIRLDKGLMDLFQLCWRLRQGELVVKQAPLDVKVGLVRSVGRKEALSSRQTAR